MTWFSRNSQFFVIYFSAVDDIIDIYMHIHHAKCKVEILGNF